jgi:predicted O-methyltransferase YrrM
MVKRSFKHWTPRYVVDRILLKAFESRHPDLPWITRASIEILATWLRPDDAGLELGSGRSTLWFARRTGRLISVEHDPAWHRRVSQMLQDRHIDNVEYHHIPQPRVYADFVKSLPDNSFDFILVDGIERDECAVACTSKLKPGGALLVDNANWYLPFASRSPSSRGAGNTPATATWGKFAELVKMWRLVWTSNGVTDTAIWVRPWPATCAGEGQPGNEGTDTLSQR